MQIQQENMADPDSNKKGVGHADPDISQGYINSGLVNHIRRTFQHLQPVHRLIWSVALKLREQSRVNT